MSGSARSIVITGDDFGANAEVNRAIEVYHRAGALHHASLMVTGEAVDQAVEIAARNPNLVVGLHLALCDARATQPSSLTDASGRFPRSPGRAGMRYAFCPWLRAGLSVEIRRQFARFHDLGFAPTYWDGHTHLHLHPTVFRLTLPIAKEYGFTATRLVREPGSWALVPQIFDWLSQAAIPRLQAAGIGFADRVFGLRHTGRMTLDAFEAAFAASGGSTEVYFHPGAEIDPPNAEELATLLARSVTAA